VTAVKLLSGGPGSRPLEHREMMRGTVPEQTGQHPVHPVEARAPQMPQRLPPGRIGKRLPGESARPIRGPIRQPGRRHQGEEQRLQRPKHKAVAGEHLPVLPGRTGPHVANRFGGPGAKHIGDDHPGAGSAESRQIRGRLLKPPVIHYMVQDVENTNVVERLVDIELRFGNIRTIEPLVRVALLQALDTDFGHVHSNHRVGAAGQPVFDKVPGATSDIEYRTPLEGQVVSGEDAVEGASSDAVNPAVVRLAAATEAYSGQIEIVPEAVFPVRPGVELSLRHLLAPPVSLRTGIGGVTPQSHSGR